MLFATLLPLLAATAAGFEFFVSKKTGTGLCVTNERGWWIRDVLPIQDIRSAALQQDSQSPKWTDEWKIKNLEIADFDHDGGYGRDFRVVVLDGSEKFKLVAGRRKRDLISFFAQASNATFTFTTEKNWEGKKGIMVYLDHFTDEKRIWAEFCPRLGKSGCTRLEEERFIDGDVLGDAKTWVWTQFVIENNEISLFKNGARVLTWKSSFDPIFTFARSHSQPGVFRIPTFSRLLPVGGQANGLSRTFTVGRWRRICVQILWAYWTSGDRGHFKLFDSANQEVRAGRLDADAGGTTILNLMVDQGGEYRLELFDITMEISHVGECPADAMEMFGPATGCATFGAVWPEKPVWEKPLFVSRINHGLQVELRLDELQRICSALNVEPKAQSEKLKFCSKTGCKFVRCPY